MGLGALLLLPVYNLPAQEGAISGQNLSPPPLFPALTGSDFRDCFVNQASLAFVEKHTAGMEYFLRFGMPELAIKSLFYTGPFGGIAFGFRYSGYGFTELMYHHFSVAGGMSVSGSLAVGVEASVNTASSSSDEAATISASGQIGLIYSVSESTSLGIHLVNPVPDRLRDNPLPSALRVGAGTSVTDRASVSAMLEKSSHRPLSAAAGLSYDITQATTIRAGFDTGTASLGFTAVFRFTGFTCSLSFVTHSRLGLSPVAALSKSF